MSITPAERYVRYRAPAENGQILCEPASHTLHDLLTTNVERRVDDSLKIFDRSLVDFSAEARRSAFHAAKAYTRSYADVESPDSDTCPLVFTGHQPELVHAGVWLKNFAAARLANHVGGMSINLIIDNDLCRAPSIRVLTGTIQQPRVESVAYDQALEKLPYEERLIVNESAWRSFGNRASDTIKPLVKNPLIEDWWQKSALSHPSSNLGYALAQARHRTELEWGNQSLELPQSHICQTASFRWFAVHFLANAAKVRSSYNEALAEYREVHRLRNHAQPLPDLIEVDAWIETPFWIWTTDNPRRRALFVRSQKSGLLLSDRSGLELQLPLSASGDPAFAIEHLATWEGQGTKLRTRALITTMYARLFLADLFIHGIGGAKYDQVTNAICKRLFGFQPPPYITLSGTLRLPIDHEPFSEHSQIELRKELREITYHPEVELAKLSLDKAAQSKIDALKQEKFAWIHTTLTPENANQRHHYLLEANLALQHWLAPRRTNLERKLVDAEQRIRANRILESREYPFCLFPRNSLRNFLLDFSSQMP